jgi:methionyl-tRNA formyltransferase
VSLAPKIDVSDARVVWTAPALRVDRLIRACTPAPGAWTTWRGERLRLGPVLPVRDESPVEPGRLRVSKTSVLVGTVTHPVALGSVQPAGKRAMSAVEWARGARLGDDERFD